ncbi:unnamed protein product [Porites lobata]|uniref:Uncharacterized protein n=1 Tax=Porites lobata TaxID=104759 RepID=A0ABN8QUX0_9CNID|nr:unnamed protein product [Porites lobata]
MQADNLRADLKTQKQDNKNLTSELQLTQAKLQTKQNEVKTLGEGLKTVEEDNRNLTSALQSTQATLQTKQEEVETLTQEINSKVESFCTLTFKPSHKIIKRSSDVTRIMKKLDELYNESNGAFSTIYLSGIPGCGKSH